MLFIKDYHVQFLIFLRVLQKLFTICVSRVPWWNFNFMHDDFHINSYSHVLCDHRLIRLILYIPKYLNIHHWLEIDQIRALEVKLKNMNEWMNEKCRQRLCKDGHLIEFSWFIITKCFCEWKIPISNGEQQQNRKNWIWKILSHWWKWNFSLD